MPLHLALFKFILVTLLLILAPFLPLKMLLTLIFSQHIRHYSFFKLRDTAAHATGADAPPSFYLYFHAGSPSSYLLAHLHRATNVHSNPLPHHLALGRRESEVCLSWADSSVPGYRSWRSCTPLTTIPPFATYASQSSKSTSTSFVRLSRSPRGPWI